MLFCSPWIESAAMPSIILQVSFVQIIETKFFPSVKCNIQILLLFLDSDSDVSDGSKVKMTMKDGAVVDKGSELGDVAHGLQRREHILFCSFGQSGNLLWT